MRHLILSLLLLPLPGVSAETDDQKIRAALADSLGVEADGIRPSPVPGLYEVIVGPRVVYVTPDGRYLVHGQVVDLVDQRNVTEAARTGARAAWMGTISEETMIIFEPDGDARQTITVFTDVDCGYCRAMHRDIDTLLGAGIRVRYLLYPREGPGTEGARKHVSVWCSKDRHDALTRAKAGQAVSTPASCESPVMANLMLGRELPVTGTPVSVTQDGEVVRGYLPAAQFIEELDRLAAQHR